MAGQADRMLPPLRSPAFLPKCAPTHSLPLAPEPLRTLPPHPLPYLAPSAGAQDAEGPQPRQAAARGGGGAGGAAAAQGATARARPAEAGAPRRVVLGPQGKGLFLFCLQQEVATQGGGPFFARFRFWLLSGRLAGSVALRRLLEPSRLARAMKRRPGSE